MLQSLKDEKTEDVEDKYSWIKDESNEDEPLMFVPELNIITLEKAEKSPLVQRMNDMKITQKLNFPETSVLATYLLEERNKDSS